MWVCAISHPTTMIVPKVLDRDECFLRKTFYFCTLIHHTSMRSESRSDVYSGTVLRNSSGHDCHFLFDKERSIFAKTGVSDVSEIGVSALTTVADRVADCVRRNDMTANVESNSMVRTDTRAMARNSVTLWGE